MRACVAQIIDERILMMQVTRVQSIHEKSLIYRDIKPDYFLIDVPGTKTANTIHIIGMSFMRLCHVAGIAHLHSPLFPFLHSGVFISAASQFNTCTGHFFLPHPLSTDHSILRHNNATHYGVLTWLPLRFRNG